MTERIEVGEGDPILYRQQFFMSPDRRQGKKAWRLDPDRTSPVAPALSAMYIPPWITAGRMPVRVVMTLEIFPAQLMD